MARHPVYDDGDEDERAEMRARHRQRTAGNVGSTKRSGGGKYLEEDLRKQLLLTRGNRSQCAKNLGVSPSSVSYSMAKWPGLLEVEREARAALWDVALGKLEAALEAGEPWAVREVLRRFGAARGMVDRLELVGPNGQPISPVVINITSARAKMMTDDQIARALDGDPKILAEINAVSEETRH